MNEWHVGHRLPFQVHMSEEGVAPLKHVFQAMNSNKNKSYNLLSTY